MKPKNGITNNFEKRASSDWDLSFEIYYSLVDERGNPCRVKGLGHNDGIVDVNDLLYTYCRSHLLASKQYTLNLFWPLP